MGYNKKQAKNPEKRAKNSKKKERKKIPKNSEMNGQKHLRNI